MPMRSGVELMYKLAVVIEGRTKTIFNLHRVVDVVADHCMIEDRVDHCSSHILHAAKDCYRKQRYYNNSGMNLEKLVIPVESVLLMDLV